MTTNNHPASPALRAGLGLLIVLALPAGCINTSTGPPATPARPRPDVVSDPAALYGQPAPDAAAELREFGQFAGRWDCRVQERNAQRVWATRPGSVSWTWFYTLGGHAIQDIWEPRADAGTPAGTNLRVYDADSGVWKSVWTASDRPQFEYWQGAAAGGEIVMQTQRDASRAKITFFDITPDSFEWRYERHLEDAWQAALKTSCVRLGRRP